MAYRSRLSKCLLGSLAALLAAAAMSGSALAGPRAQQGASVSLTARAGFDGNYKDGRWLPVRINVANDGADVRGTLRITAPRNDGSVVVFTREVELPTQSRREIFMYIPAEGFFRSLEVFLVDGSANLAPPVTVRLSLQASANDLVYGVLAGSPSAFNVLADVSPISGLAHVAQLELADLPPVDLAWQALDVLVISDVDTGAMSPEQRQALAGWVANGGRLIVTGGPGWQKTAAGLAGLLPLAPAGTRPAPDLKDLAAFAAAAPPAGEAVAAVGSLSPDAVVRASAGDIPLVVTRRSGLGLVTYLAVDPAFAPLRGWEGLEGVFRNILSENTERPSWATGLRNWYSARDAVNAVPGLDLPSTLQICGFLGLYIIVIGPLNYLVLRRLRRRELAWVTIPGLVLVFSAATYLTGYQLRGTQANLHRLTIVQVWPEADQAQVDQIVGIFSPRRASYDLQFEPGFLVRPMPSDGGLGGAGALTMEQGDQTRVSDVHVDVGAVQAFVSQGQVSAPQFASDLTLDVTSSLVRLEGTLTNHSDLTLTDVVLLAPGPRNVLSLGDLRPGETANISLPLFNSRATPAPLNVVAPAVSSTIGTALPPSSYSPGGYDTTIEDILGTSNFYSDRNSYRRYSLLSATIDSYSGVSRGNGVYLVGWTSASPAGSQVLDHASSALDLTAYFIYLRPALKVGEGLVRIPPALMNWMVLDPGSAGSPTPYDMYLYQHYDYALRFMPAQPVLFRDVRGLTMHVTNYGATGTTGLAYELWDFGEQAWVQQDGILWGDNEIQNPGRYAGPAGEIHVRVSNPFSVQVNLERVDFTLVVEQ